jgi:CP family cyanate transporter-like MFS transporter
VTRAPVALTVALALVGLNLRLGIASVPPIVDEVRSALGLSSTAAGAVTTLPVLCFGFAAFGAPGLARRWGDERVVFGCLSLVFTGITLRLVTSVWTFFGGTLLLGIGIAVINVLIPSIVKRFYPRPGAITGLFVTAIMTGGGLAIALTVPLSDALGDWDRALAVWALPALVATLVWAPLALRRDATRPAPAPPLRLRGDREAWLLAGMFACQTLLGFALLAWVPKILQDSGLGHGAAGVLAALVMVLGIPTAVAVPVLAARNGVSRALVVASSAPWWAGLAGVVLAPTHATALWMVLLGLGQGAGFALPLSLIVLRARDARHAAALSSMVQGVGYVFGGLLGPPVMGALHDLTGTWTASLLMLMVITGAQLAFGLAAVGRRAPVRVSVAATS